MLHYKYLGIDYVVKRYAELSSGPGYKSWHHLWDRNAICLNHQKVILMAGVVVPVSPWQDFKLFLSFLPWKALALLQIPVYYFLTRFAKALRLLRRRHTA